MPATPKKGRRFGGDAGVLDSSIEIGGEPHQIIGVRQRVGLVEIVDAPDQAAVSVSPSAEVLHVHRVRGDSLELALEVTPPASGEFVVKVRRSSDAAEETAIICDTKSGELRIDLEKNSLDRSTNHKGYIFGAPRDPATRPPVSVP